MKNIIKSILIILISLLLTNCEQELLQDSIEVKTKFNLKILNKEKIQNNFILSKKLEVIKKGLSNNKNKSVYSELYDFTIETDYAELTENEDGTQQSYTFPITRTVSNGLIENFVLTLQEDGSYKGTYFSYDITEQEIESLENGIEIDLTDKTEILEITDEFLISSVVQNKLNGIYVLVPRVITVTEQTCGLSGCSISGHYTTSTSVVYILTFFPNTSSGNGTVPDNADGGGSNVSGGSSNTSGNFYRPTTRPANPNRVKWNRFTYNLSRNAQLLLETNLSVNGSAYMYLIDNDFSEASENVVLNAVNFINNNQNSQEVIDFVLNSYFKTYPEIDYNQEVINPDDITYDEPLTQQSLPSFNDFKNNFPKNQSASGQTIYEMPANEVYALVGGSLLNSFNSGLYQNACSIRGSRGLLYSNIQIPVLNYNGSQRTQKGADNYNYILSAKAFNKYMIDKFGETTDKLTGAAANDPQQVMDFLAGKNGIYVIVNNASGTAGYSGHVDLIIDGECVSNAYLNPSGGVASIRIWSLN